MSPKKSVINGNSRGVNKSQADRETLKALAQTPVMSDSIAPEGESPLSFVVKGESQPKTTKTARLLVPKDAEESAENLLQDEVVPRNDSVSDASSQVWTLAQASNSAAPEAAASDSCQVSEKSSKECDDDKAALWQYGTGSLLQVGLAGAGILLASHFLKDKDKDDTANLETGLAAGPFKANGMKLQYFGTSGLLLELAWDEDGKLTKDVRTGLEGEVQVQKSFVEVDGVRVEVITGVTVKFATYTGALLAILVDDATDNLDVEYYDEVAGLMALEGVSLRAFTTINSGENKLAITPFTELALRKAGFGIDMLETPDEIKALLNNNTQTKALDQANKEITAWAGVDIVSVLPVAVNDVARTTAGSQQAKDYGDLLASLSRLVPGNLNGGLEKLLDANPDSVVQMLDDSLSNFKDDNNDPSNPITPPSVAINRPPVNALEGAQAISIEGTSTEAVDGSVVRISIFKNGVLLLSQKTLVTNNEWSIQLEQTLVEMGVRDSETLTIRAYIDPDHPAEVEMLYDATPPSAQVSGFTLSQDTGVSGTDRITNVASQTFRGSLNEALGQGETLRSSLDGGIRWTDITDGVRGTSFSIPDMYLSIGNGQVRFQVQDAAGNKGSTTQYGYTLDKTPPGAPSGMPDLLTADDSGRSSSDNITNNTHPRLVVGALPALVDSVQLLVDGVLVDATYNALDGTLRPVQGLGEGEHSLSIRWVDVAGNPSAPSPALVISVDTELPALRMGNIDISADSGSSNTDFATRFSAQTVSGQLDKPLGAGEKVYGSVDNGASWVDVTSMINGSWQLNWTGVSLQDGQNSLQFKVVDAAGNTSPISQQAYQLDQFAPEMLVSNISISTDTGISSTDFITKQASQTVTGRLMDDGQPQSLDVGDRLWASSNGGASWQDITATVNGSTFSWANVTLASGANSLQFKVIDDAGNEGGVSSKNYTLDTVAPAAPQNFSWATYPNGINTNTNTVTGVIGNVPFTYTLNRSDTSPLNLLATGNMAGQGLFPTSFQVPNTTSIRNDFASINQLTFDSPMSNPVLAFGSIGSPGNPVTIEFPMPVEVLWSSAVTIDAGTASAATRLTGREGALVVRLNGTVDEFFFNYLSDEAYVNFAFGAAIFDLLSAEQDTGIKSIDDITQVTRPAFHVQNKPADAVSAELLINGRVVDATFNAVDNTLTPNLPLSDGVYQVSYRYSDIAGNVSVAASVTQVTIDTRAPDNISLNTFTPAAIGGTYERGTTLSLKINGVDIAANRIVLDESDSTWSLVPTLAELNAVSVGWLNKANSTFDLIATDAAGNVTVSSKTVTKDVFNAPYVKEFIPTDGGILANDTEGIATLNLVFSKSVLAGSGRIKLWDVATDTLVSEVDVTTPNVRIENGSDVYVTLPGLTTGVPYYVTLDAGTFVDSAGQHYAGKNETGTTGWDFVGALASIAPDFVAQDDIINISESAAVVRITGKVVSNADVLEDIVLANLSVSVSTPQGAAAVSATLQSYNNQTGEFVFTVPASKWANGNYGYTVSLLGTAGDAASVSASYNFANLAVDLVAPTGITSSIDSIMDNAGQTQGNVFAPLATSLEFLESEFATPDGTTVVTDLNVTDLDLGRLLVSMGSAWTAPVNGQPVVGTYNSGSTVYNADRTSVTFWMQNRGTQAVKLQLTDTVDGIELKIIDAKSGPSGLATTYNWNINGTQQSVATSWSGAGYGVLGLEYPFSLNLLDSGYASTSGTNKVTDTNVADIDLSQLNVKLGGAWLDQTGQTVGIYNTASSVYNTDKTSVTFWVQTVQANPNNGVVHTKAVQLQLTDTVNGIQVKLMAAKYFEGSSPLPVDYNWNTQPAIPISTATFSSAEGYGVSSIVIGNTNSMTNGQTDDATPTLNGTLTRALAQDERIAIDRTDGDDNTVTITGKDGLIVDGTQWTFNDGTLTAGQYTYRAYVEDAAGNRSAASPQRVITLELTAPTTEVTAATLSRDTGDSQTDRVTKTPEQTITGTLSAALVGGEKLMASLDGGITFVDITTMVTGTQFVWMGVTLSQGAGTVLWEVADAMGNRGNRWQLAFTLDTTGPDAPTTAPDLPATDDDGNSDTDNITSELRPNFSVNALPDGSVDVELLVDGVLVASVYDATNQTLTPTLSLAAGSHQITYRYVDLAGNSGLSSDPLVATFEVDTSGIVVIDPAWEVNASKLTIDYSATSKGDWLDARNTNNEWDQDQSYRTDNDDVFAYDFGRVYWDDELAGGDEDLRWEHRGWQIGQGDRIQGATFLPTFDGSQMVAVPESFGSVAGGDDMIDKDQFEVYYGTLVNGVFTITSTEEFANSQTSYIGGATNTLGEATHTLIMFDNDIQSSKKNTLNDLLGQGDNTSYLPVPGYREVYNGVEINLSDPYWLEAAVVTGVYHEKGWVLSSDADGQKLGWSAPPDYISIGRLDADQSAFGAWFDTNEDGVRDAGEQQIELSHSGDMYAMTYSYTLSGVDFAAGHYTVRIVDPVMSQQGSSTDMGVPVNPWGGYGTLELGEMVFRDDDRLIIDQFTNAASWEEWVVDASSPTVTLALGASEPRVMVNLGIPITQDNLIFMV